MYIYIYIYIDGCVGLFVCGLPTLVQNSIYIFLRTIYKIVHSPELYINKSELYIYIYCGKPSSCNSEHKKSTRKTTRKSEKTEVCFPKVPASKSHLLGPLGCHS